MKTVFKRIGKIALIALSAIVGLVVLTLAVLNVAKFAIYSEYYGIKENLCKNPGLGDGFVCQGICIDESTGHVLVSGYMQDGSASRIYVTTLENDVYYVTLTQSGKDFDGHVGGISLNADTVYLANDNRLHTFSLKSVLNAQKGDKIDVGEGVEVNNEASFCYADENYVYVGEFHDGGKYVTDHPYQTPEGMHYAIVSRYTHGNLTQPDKIYSIRDKVQGICFTPDGEIILSTSYGLSDSHYYVYRESDAIASGEMLDGAEVYYLNNCQRDVKGPAMSEGLDWYDGKVITLTESASNKYIFGKFFFANKIVALNFK